jgi:short-subunit dehydrogenase
VSAATALVTGGGSGIGRAIAIALGARGMRVVLAGRRVARLEESAAAIEKAGGSAVVHPCDLAGDDAVNTLATITNDAGGGKLSVLVHSAARFAMAPVEQTSIAELDAIMRVNIHAPFVLTGALLPALRAARGDIVFINSSAAIGPGPKLAAYAASKAALKAFAESLRHEINRDSVRVLNVFPGRTATAMQAEVFRIEGRTYEPEKLIQPEDIAAAVVVAITLSPTAELTDLHIRPAKK